MVLKYIVAALFVAVYFIRGRELGFTSVSPFYTHLTFSFQHGSIIHLILNTLVFISAFRVMERFVKPFVLFLAIYIISVLASFSSVTDIPTVGSSGMIYAMFGMETVIVIYNNATGKQKRIFFFGIIVMLTASFFNAGSSFIVHITSYTFGTMFYMVKRWRHLRRHLHPLKKLTNHH
jgi:membrane associated rhomboid family serine protease